MKKKTASLLGLALASCVLSPRAEACAAFGSNGPVSIQGEEALIVWDPAHETEHFIRHAFFDHAPADFGFLVPTPSKPELAEAKQGIFERLFDTYRAPPQQSSTRGLFNSHSNSAAIPAAAAVQVIEQKTVAGLDATVLLAKDAEALDAWLAKNHYPNGPALSAWITPYVDRGNYITAFRIASAGAATLASTSVRMSFKTKTPVFPYSEPDAKYALQRPFRLSVIAPTKMAGVVGNKAWRADLGFAKPIGVEKVKTILLGSVPQELLRPSWLTVFDEPDSKRGSDDLELRAAGNDKQVAPTLTFPIQP